MTNCQLCRRPVPPDRSSFCCSGCEAVAGILQKLPLAGGELEERRQRLLEVVFAESKTARQSVVPGHETRETALHISGMVCPSCSWILHRALIDLTGVADASVNFINETCSIRYDPMQLGAESIEERIRDLGYTCSPADESQDRAPDVFSFGIGWFAALNVMMLSFVVYAAESWEVPPAMRMLASFFLPLLTVPVLFFSGRETIRKGWAQWRRLNLAMESLVLLSAMTALLYSLVSIYKQDFTGLYFDVVCLLVMLVETGNMITGNFYRRLRQRVLSMRRGLPCKVRCGNEDAEAEEVFRDIKELLPGETFRVYQNEVIPVDGILLEEAELDFSLITGESRGIASTPGQFAGAGARLCSPQCLFAVTPDGPASLLERIITSTMSAFETRQEQPGLGDRIARVFAPLVIFIAASAAVSAWLGGEQKEALLVFLRVLIVACPCAFGIAEPLVLAAAAERLQRLGVQVLDGNVLRTPPDLIVFDKTGTLTEPRMNISHTHWCSEEDSNLLHLLAGLEQGLEHPVAHALAGIAEPWPVTNRQIFPGLVTGDYQGREIRSGRLDLAFPDFILPAEMQEFPGTLVACGQNRRCQLLIGLGEVTRSESASLLKTVKDLKLHPVLCSGDRTLAVSRLGMELGFNEILAEQSPADKEAVILRLKSSGERVMMVGDGINDAQSLAAADIGVAVISGQYPIRAGAAVILSRGGLQGLDQLLQGMIRVRGLIRANYAWSFLYNGIGISLALSGTLTPTFCAVGMALSNSVVVLNSLRISTWKPPAGM